MGRVHEKIERTVFQQVGLNAQEYTFEKDVKQKGHSAFRYRINKTFRRTNMNYGSF